MEKDKEREFIGNESNKTSFQRATDFCGLSALHWSAEGDTISVRPLTNRKSRIHHFIIYRPIHIYIYNNI